MNLFTLPLLRPALSIQPITWGPDSATDLAADWGSLEHDVARVRLLHSLLEREIAVDPEPPAWLLSALDATEWAVADPA